MPSTSDTNVNVLPFQVYKNGHEPTCPSPCVISPGTSPAAAATPCGVISTSSFVVTTPFGHVTRRMSMRGASPTPITSGSPRQYVRR